jgi:hypothetical protein
LPYCIIHITCSLWLALLLLFGTTPREALHQFARHKDTAHLRHEAGTYLEKEHHHCSFLDLLLSPFANDVCLIPYTYHPPIFFEWYNLAFESRLTTNPLHTALRGPPALV